MFKFLKAAAPALVLALSAASANAAVIGSITHDYGSADGAVASATSAGTCDTLNATSITVRDTRGCQRFYDAFDISAFTGQAIDSFTLKLSFSNTANLFEDWHMRPADSATHGSSIYPNMTEADGVSMQSFTVSDATNHDVFNGMIANKRFFLWFAEEGLGAHNFELNSATLEVNDATKVPEPSSVALLGLALLGLGAARRRSAR